MVALDTFDQLGKPAQEWDGSTGHFLPNLASLHRNGMVALDMVPTWQAPQRSPCFLPPKTPILFVLSLVC
jgi:hypothetical protein